MWVTKNTKYVGGIVLEFKSISTFRVPFALVSCNNLCILEQNLQIIITRGRLGWMSNILLKGPTNPVIFSSRIVSRTRATHTWVRFPRTGKMVKMWLFIYFFNRYGESDAYAYAWTKAFLSCTVSNICCWRGSINFRFPIYATKTGGKNMSGYFSLYQIFEILYSRAIASASLSKLILCWTIERTKLGF